MQTSSWRMIATNLARRCLFWELIGILLRKQNPAFLVNWFPWSSSNAFFKTKINFSKVFNIQLSFNVDAVTWIYVPIIYRRCDICPPAYIIILLTGVFSRKVAFSGLVLGCLKLSILVAFIRLFFKASTNLLCYFSVLGLLYLPRHIFVINSLTGFIVRIYSLSGHDLSNQFRSFSLLSLDNSPFLIVPLSL